MSFRTEDDVVRKLRQSSVAELECDMRQVCDAVNFDGLTTAEAELLWAAFFIGHGWSQIDYLRKVNGWD